MTPVVECDQIHACVGVEDVEAAVEFYTTKLGFKTGFVYGDPPHFAGVNLGNVQMFLGRSKPTPAAGISAAYFLLEDVDPLYEFHRSNGVEIVQEIGDREYGIRDYAIRDLNGYSLSFGHHLQNQGPPVPIERVAVPLRMEKRLASLLADLASHKRMTIDSCLEEMILHTNEGVGPHTAATLRHIVELKKKYGIDYDCHASYRFVEN